MNISAVSIRRPIATSLLMAALMIGGVIGYNLLPVAALPTVDFPTIAVTANLPGADPETMAASVAQPLERQFASLPGVNQITSTRVLGTTVVTLQFDLSRNIDGAAGDVQGAINAALGNLPKNLPAPPTYRKVNPRALALVEIERDDAGTYCAPAPVSLARGKGLPAQIAKRSVHSAGRVSPGPDLVRHGHPHRRHALRCLSRRASHQAIRQEQDRKSFL